MRALTEELSGADGDRQRESAVRGRMLRLNRMWGMVEAPECRRSVVLRLFGESSPARCGNCDRCRRPVGRTDATADARLLVKAVAATGRCHGLGYVTEVLQGIPTERVCLAGAHELPLFGKGRHLGRREWAALFRQALVNGVLDVKESGAVDFGSCGWPMLQGRATMSVAGEPLELAPVSRRRTSGLETAVGDAVAKLLTLRDEHGAETLTDRNIEEILSYRPETPEEVEQLLGGHIDRTLSVAVAEVFHGRDQGDDADESIAGVALF